MASRAVPLGRVNVDTDQIVPKQFLKLVERTGFGEHLFHNWRRLDGGTTPDPSFVLNDPAYEGARILVAGDNFGCGSSREHAVWALVDYGFDVVIAPSFADIFYGNCFKNGLLPVALGRADVDALLAASAPRPRGAAPPPEVAVDLEAQTVSAACIGTVRFEIGADRRAALLAGMDEIDLTLGQYGGAISSFESGPGAPPSAIRSRRPS